MYDLFLGTGAFSVAFASKVISADPGASRQRVPNALLCQFTWDANPGLYC